MLVCQYPGHRQIAVQRQVFSRPRPARAQVFDFHHQKFCPGGFNEKDALYAAMATWPKGVRPVVHWSESQEGRIPHAHSDYISVSAALSCVPFLSFSPRKSTGMTASSAYCWCMHCGLLPSQARSMQHVEGPK